MPLSAEMSRLGQGQVQHSGYADRVEPGGHLRAGPEEPGRHAHTDGLHEICSDVD